jgi:hypothetical protein
MTPVQIIGLVFACLGVVGAVTRILMWRAELKSRRELTEAIREQTREKRTG